MSNLHGILNNLVNELTESTWNLTPNDNDMSAVRAGIDQQENAERQAAIEREYKLQTALNQIAAKNAQIETELKAGRAPDVAEFLQHSAESQAANDAHVRAAQPSLYDQAKFYGHRFGREATDLYNTAKDEVSANPWLYGGLGAAALASGAGALALRKRLAKTKNQ